MAIITANNHYAGFGPMTAKLFAEMMNLKDHIRPFPILDYKYLLMKLVQVKKKITEYTNNDIQSQDKLTFLNSSNNITNWILLIISDIIK